MAKHEVTVFLEEGGTYRSAITCEGGRIDDMIKTRGHHEVGAPCVVIRDEQFDGPKFHTANVLQAISPAAARRLAEKLLLAADDAEAAVAATSPGDR